MFSISMNGQDKTNQIIDWKLWEKDNKLNIERKTKTFLNECMNKSGA